MVFRILSFLNYFWTCCKHSFKGDEFITRFKKEVLQPKPKLNSILKLRSFYAQEDKILNNEDYGAGSKAIKNKSFLSTKTLYQNVAISHKHGTLLYNLVQFLKAESTLELGTSLGLSAAYMAQSKVTSIEGNFDLAANTTKNLQNFEFLNINVLHSQFDDILINLLKQNQYDMIFIDGNHTEIATLRYFESCLKYSDHTTVMIFDDIYWSKGMSRAWKKIKNHPSLKLSIDLFKFGIVFFKANNNESKKNMSLWY